MSAGRWVIIAGGILLLALFFLGGLAVLIWLAPRPGRSARLSGPAPASTLEVKRSDALDGKRPTGPRTPQESPPLGQAPRIQATSTAHLTGRVTFLTERLPAKRATVQVSSTDRALRQLQHEVNLCRESEELDPSFVRARGDIELAAAFLRGETASVDARIRALHVDRFIGAGSVLATASADEDGQFRVEIDAPTTVFLLVSVDLFGKVSKTGKVLHVPADPPETRVEIEVDDRSASLGGRLVDASGAAVAGAVVLVSARAPLVGVHRWKLASDEQGLFGIEKMFSSERIQLSVRKEGFLPLHASFPLPPGSSVHQVHTMRTAPTIVGSVEDERASPVQGARVFAVAKKTGAAGGHTRSVFEAETDRDGHFSVTCFSDVPSVKILCRRPGFAAQRVDVRLADAAPVRIRLLRGGLAVEGKVVDTRGAGVRAEVQITTPDVGRAFDVAQTGADGTFRFEGLEPIEHLLTAMSEQGAEEMPVTPPATGLVVALEEEQDSRQEREERKRAGEEEGDEGE